MRIDRLDLLAFGCFTDRVLDLSAPGVHVVTGPNEAGKSTARHAIGQLLYGIDVQTRYGFVHGMTDLRLGALLRDADGGELAVVRHKRRNNPLTTPDGTPLDERELTRVLADVAARDFHDVFSLDHQQLRRGGADLLAGKGDIGRALFESRSSSRLADIQAALVARSAELWLKGGKRRINNAVKRFPDLRRSVQDAALDPREFAAAEKAVVRAEEELARLGSDLHDLRARQARLAQLRTALPHLLQRTELLQELAELSGSSVPDHAGTELDTLTTRLRQTRITSDRDRADLALVEAELDTLHVDDAYFAHEADLDTLHAREIAVREAAAQATQADHERTRLHESAQHLLAQVRPGHSLSAPESYATPPGLPDRVTALRRELAATEAALAAARAQAARRQDKLTEARATTAASPPAADTTDLRALLTSLPEGLTTNRTRASAHLSDLTTRTESVLSRLGVPFKPAQQWPPTEATPHEPTATHNPALSAGVGGSAGVDLSAREDASAGSGCSSGVDASSAGRDASTRAAGSAFVDASDLAGSSVPVDQSVRADSSASADSSTSIVWPACSVAAALVGLVLPARDQVAGHRVDVDGLRVAVDAVALRRREVAGRLEDAERELLALWRLDPAPSEGELRRARSERDALWGALVARPDAVVERGAAFEDALRHADDVADRRGRAAEAAVRRVQLEVAVERDRALLDELAAEAAAHAARGDELADAWAQLWRDWTAAGGAAPVPAAAAAILDGVAELIGLVDETGRTRRAHDDWQAQEEALVGRFRVELSRFGGPPRATAVRELAALAELRLGEAAAAQHAHEAAAAAERAAADELGAAHEDLRRAETARADWDVRWAEVVRDAGLVGAPDPETVAAAVDTLAEVGRMVHRISEATHRHDTAAARVAEFDGKLGELLGSAWGVAIEPGEARFAQLAERHAALGKARTARDRRDMLGGRADDLRRAIALGDTIEKSASAELAGLVAAHGLPDEAALREAVDRTARLRAKQAELAAAEARLRDTGRSIEESERLAREWSAADLDAELAQLAADVERAEAAYNAQGTELGRVRQVLSAIDDEARAARVQEEAAVEIAELAVDVEHYVRLELAREVLVRCVEEYRRENQDPVLGRAKALFTALTGGRFTDLVIETDGRSGEGVLVARRSGADASVPVEVMSEGTRDQLYLALRLATLERYADAGRAMPLILDDIAMTFDDGRTAALLRVLDGMADRFQIVLFTHHAHLGELARRALPPARAHVHELPVFAGS